MTVHLWDNRLTYVSVPKCASGSLKRSFYELIHGEPFVRRWFRPSIHQLLPSRKFASLPHRRIAGHHRITVVRDPVGRLVSGYSAKILRNRCLEEPSTRLAVRAAGLSTRPGLEEFLRNLSRYKLVSRVIRPHFRPLSYFLGNDPSWFSRIYDISEVDELAGDVQARTGRSIRLRHMNRNTSNDPWGEVTPAVRVRVHDIFREDMTLYGAYFASSEQPNSDRGAMRLKKQGGHHG
jgi:hypothetical protein